jgi:hypothetical protein
LIKIDDMSKGENKSPKLWPEGQSKKNHVVGTVNKFSILYNTIY